MRTTSPPETPFLLLGNGNYFSAACNRKVQASSSRYCVDNVDISMEDTGHQPPRRSSQLIWAETYLLSDFTLRQVEKRTASTASILAVLSRADQPQ